MKKIRFQQPKYILPLIVLPFCFIFNYLYLDIVKPAEAKGAESELRQTSQIITDLPDANLNKKEINDKFEAGIEKNKYRTDYSAIRELGDEKGPVEQYGSVYTDEEKAMLDSMNAAILTNQPSRDFSSKVNERQEQNRSRYASTTTFRPRAAPKSETAYQKEMRLFKEQMRFIDSLEKAGQGPPAPKQQPKPASKEPEALAVSKSANPNNAFFNTITDNGKEDFIKAILDEGLRVRDGGRIRIRLLDDIYVSDYQIEEGSYLYGIVSGFSAQRVEIKVSSILYGNQIIPVDLSMYDNDGLAGIYVPDSQFRAFTKELASNTANSQAINFDQDPQSTNQVLLSMVDRMAQTTTKAVGKAIKQNKAKLKYNTIVYLIDNKAKRK